MEFLLELLFEFFGELFLQLLGEMFGGAFKAAWYKLRGRDHAPRASGTLEAHYAPDAKVRLMDAGPIQTALDLLGADAAHIAIYARSIVRIKSDKVLYRRMPDDALAAAQQLFAVLRDFDAKGVKLIWVENPPRDAEWDGVRDRLGRAAAS